MCEFHDCNCNGLGDMWWTDKCTYLVVSVHSADLQMRHQKLFTLARHLSVGHFE